MINILEAIFWLAALIWLVPFAHETGHYIYLTERLGFKDVEMKFKKGFPNRVVWKEERETTPAEEVDIHLAGILAGIVPFIGVMNLINSILLIPLFITYLIACRKDILVLLKRGKK